MKVSVPFDFTEMDRRAIARFLGYDGLASHVQCLAWARLQLRAALTVMALEPAPRGALPSVNRQVTDLDAPVLIGGVVRE